MKLPPTNTETLLRLIDRHFDAGSVQRGRHYFRAGHVRASRIDQAGDTIVLTGDVQGAERAPYHLSLALIGDAGGLTIVNDSCSCPLGCACKHGVALLLELASRLVAPAEPAARKASIAPWDQWFSAAPAALPLPPVVASAAADAQQLGFIFDLERAAVLPNLTVRPVWLGRLKNGDWGKPETLRINGLGTVHIKRTLDEDQHALVAALRMATMAYVGNETTFRITGPRGAALVDALLRRQWCCWQKPRLGRLVPGEPHTPQWTWRIDDTGTQRLLIDDSDGLTLLRAGSLCYLDAAHGRFGHVDADVALIERLLQMPALAPAHVAQVTRRWQRDPQLATLPSPLPPPTTRVISAPPVAVLTLGFAAPDAHRSTPTTAFYRKQHGALPMLYVARLSFDYDGHRVTAGGVARAGKSGAPAAERRLVNGELLRIERDAVRERKAAATLRALGLQAIDRITPALPWPMQEWLAIDDLILGSNLARRDPDALPAMASTLGAAGCRIEFAAEYPIDLLDAPDDWYGSVDGDGGGERSGADWFGVELGIRIGNERVSLLPILARALEDPRFPLQATADEPADATWLAPLDERRRVPLPLVRLRALIVPLLEWLSPGMATDAPLRVPRLAVDALTELQANVTLNGAQPIQAFAERLRLAGRDLTLRVPKSVNATPRGYQLDGLRWLRFLADAGLGGVLADDMGLGKTLQVLMHLQAEKSARRLSHPALVVCPTSVIGNWREQAARFTPKLRVLVLHGADRQADHARVASHDIVITTYALLPRDHDALLEQRFSIAIFDEAQAIKNPRSKAALTARAIRADRRLAVTGTPLENHLGELWAQIDCVLPGLLGDSKHFTRYFRTPIEKHGDLERQQRLNRRIAPFVLRRNKDTVATELPAKTIIERTVELDGRQRDLYETLRLAMHERVRAALGKRGLGQSSIVILDALLKLRQVCCDPRLVKLGDSDGAKSRERRADAPSSAKLALLLPMLEELLDEGRRVLLFSQFTGMLDLIEAALRERDIAFVRLDGSTRDRDTPIRRFQNNEVPLFLISLKAGGTGLNLTVADTVIHYDPWWNPAVEAQATDRAHRIGQDKPVFVYKLICTGTVEEKIQAMQQRKAGLAKAVLDGGARSALAFDEADIDALFAPMA